MGASCSTATSASPKTSRANSKQLPSTEPKAAENTPARAVPDAAKVKLAAAAAAGSQDEPVVAQADAIATAPQCAPQQAKAPEPCTGAPPAASDSANHHAPAGDHAAQPGAQADEHAVSEAKFENLLEQERVKRTRRRSAVGGAAGDFGGQLEEAMGGEDVHPDVLAMMKEAEAAHRAAGLEPLKAQSVPAAAELKAAAAVVVPAAAAVVVPAAAAVVVPAAAAIVAEVKQEAAPAPAAVPEAPKEKTAEPVASAPAAAPEAPKEKAAEPVVSKPAAEPVAAVSKPAVEPVDEASKPAAEPVDDASKPAAEPVAAAAAVEVAEKPARDYQRGKTGVTSIHSTYSATSDKDDLDGENMDGALHDEVSASAMQQAPDSCDNAIAEGDEAAAAAEAAKDE